MSLTTRDVLIGECFYIWAGFDSPPIMLQCTDVGSRTIAAIRVDSVRAVSPDGSPVLLTETQARSFGVFLGPPYRVHEHVLDEDDLEMCYPTLEAARDHQPSPQILEAIRQGRVVDIPYSSPDALVDVEMS